MTIRQFERPDLAWAQELNRREVPFVNFLNLADFEALIMRSAYARLFLNSDENPIGLLVGFLPGAAYQSANYRWISDGVTCMGGLCDLPNVDFVTRYYLGSR